MVISKDLSVLEKKVTLNHLINTRRITSVQRSSKVSRSMDIISDS